MKLISFLFFFFNISICLCDSQIEFSAQDILEKSIDFCGGIKNISKIKSTSLVYELGLKDSSLASIIIKREISNKYTRSFISEKHSPSSMQFDGSELTIINAENKRIVNDINSIEEIKLQTYNHPQIGYKELNYSLKRLEDQKFNYFDCFVVRATAKNGYITLNYFDKTNFRLLMIIYPKGNKSLLQEFVFKDSVLFNSRILNVDENSDQMTWVLRKIENNIKINPLWFKVDKSTNTSLPEYIKKGIFISADSTIVNRTDSIQTEKNSKLNHTLFLTWINNYTFGLINYELINKKIHIGTEDIILVKIVSWNKNEYVCHYFLKGASGTQEYKIQ
jgi:hypothetical protein